MPSTAEIDIQAHSTLLGNLSTLDLSSFLQDKSSTSRQLLSRAYPTMRTFHSEPMEVVGATQMHTLRASFMHGIMARLHTVRYP